MSSVANRRILVAILALSLLVGGLFLWRSTSPPLPFKVRVIKVTDGLGLHGQIVVLTDGNIMAADYRTIFTIGPSGNESSRFDAGPADNHVHIDPNLAMTTDGTLVFSRRRGAVVALRDGKISWEFADPGSFAKEPLPLPDGGLCVIASNRLVRLAPGGSVLWTYTAAATLYQAPWLAPDGGLHFAEAMRSNSFMVKLNADGSLRWRHPSDPGRGPAFAQNGTIYWGRETNITLAAFKPDGTPLWQLNRPEQALSLPVVGRDGTIFLTANVLYKHVLLAVSPDGRLKWEFNLESSATLDAPAIGSDGTLYLVTRDRWVRAISPDGQLKWHYRVKPRPAISRNLTWKALLSDLRTDFGESRTDLHGPPVPGPDGKLYVNFGHTGSIYIFEPQSVGPAAASSKFESR